jgi:Uma2 family endonuclease
MIALRDSTPRLTPSEYLAWEEQQKFRYEYIDGEILAMTGGTINHSRIAVNFSTILRNHLRGSGCQILNSDAKVQITGSTAYFYPDVSVTCDELDRNAEQFISYPCLIIEVLSPSTEADDRGRKFRKYRRSVSLQEYVLVNTNEMCLDVYQKNERGRWELVTYVDGDMVELKSVNLTLPIEQIYEDIVFVSEDSITEET